MKILIYGAGVIGSIFASKLSIVGNNVTVLARGQRLTEINNMGVIIRKANTKKEEKAMIEQFGEGYMEYSKQVPAFIPAIGAKYMVR